MRKWKWEAGRLKDDAYLLFFFPIIYLLDSHSLSRQMTNSVSASPARASSSIHHLHHSPSPRGADEKTCLRPPKQPSLQAILCTRIIHREQDSHFYSWEWLILESKERSTVKRMTLSPTLYFPSQGLFHGFFCTVHFSSHSRIHLSVLRKYLHMSQGLLGLVFIYKIEMGFF